MRQNRPVNRVATLVSTQAIWLERFDHAPGVPHRDPDLERASTHALSVVETGSFSVRIGKTWQRVTPGYLFVAPSGLEFACRHDEGPPRDECLSLRYSDEAVESLRSAGAIAARGEVRALSNRQAYLLHGLRRDARDAGLDAARLEAVAGALYHSLGNLARNRAVFRAGQLAWYVARVERAKALMRAHYDEPLSLSRMAREVGMSTYHFARVFAELEGQPPHRFLTELRLAEATARLRAGASVTETCFAVGFGSLSHFSTTFKRRFGARPSVSGATR